MLEEKNQIRQLTDIIHFENREEREESSEFVKNKALFKKNGAKCFIDNHECDGAIEIHHNIIQHAAANEIDWNRVKADYGFDHVDDMKNLIPICKRHHTGKGTGIHMMTYPAWILQKYYKPEPLSNFEAIVKQLKEGKLDVEE